MILLANRYTCPVSGKVTTQCHVIENYKFKKSYNKMAGDDLSLFTNYKRIIIVDVVRAINLKDVNLIVND